MGDKRAAVTAVDCPANMKRKHELPLYYDNELRNVGNSSSDPQGSSALVRRASGVLSLSCNSLEEVTSCPLERNKKALKDILECQRDKWKNKELLELVEKYFGNSLQTLDFCTALNKCFERAQDSQRILHSALQQFKEEGTAEGKPYAKTLEELRNFKAIGNPFTEGIFQIFQSVYERQVSMLGKLQLRKGKIDKKLKVVKTWRKVSIIIFVAASTTVIISSVVAAAIAATPVASALAAASSIPLGSMGKWIDSLWKGYKVKLKGQKKMIHKMEVGTHVAINDLDSIRVLVRRLVVEIEAMMQNAEFALQDVEAVKIGVEEIKKKQVLFMKSIKYLEEQANRCSRDVCREGKLLVKDQQDPG